MNRRMTLRLLMAIPVIAASRTCLADNRWIELDRRTLRPNSRSISIDMRAAGGIAKIAIELRGNSIWLYKMKVIARDGAHVRPVNLNFPPTREGSQPSLAAWPIGEDARSVVLDFSCLPLTRKPTQLLLWGSA